MIEYIRNNSKKLFVLIILAIVILSFVIFGTTRLINITKFSSLITVGSLSISQTNFQQQMVNYKNALYRQPKLKKQIEMIAANNSNMSLDQTIAQILIQQLVSQYVFLAYLDSLNMIVSTHAIAEALANDQNFQVNGKFDANVYRQFLQNENISETTFKSDLQHRLLTDQFVPLFLNFPFPDRLITLFYNITYATWQIRYGIIPFKNFPITAVNNANVKKYYNTHKKTYQLPERKNLTVLWVTQSNLSQHEPVSNKEILAAYNARKNLFSTPEKRAFTYYIFKTQALAKKAYTQTKKGVSIRKTRITHQTSRFELTTKSEIPVESLADAIFSTPKNKVSAPVQLAAGWALIQPTKIQKATETPLSQLKKQLRIIVQDEKAQNTLATLSDKVQSSMAKGVSLTEIAKKNNLTLHTVQNSTVAHPEGTTPNTPSKLIDTLKQTAVVNAINATGEKHTSSVITLGNNTGIVVVQVNKIYPSATPSYASIQSIVKKHYILYQQIQATKAKAETIENKAKNTSLAKLMKVKSGTYSPNAQPKKTIILIMQNAFKQNLTKNAVGTVLTQNGLLIYQIASVKKPNPLSSNENKTFTSRFNNQMIGMILADIQKVLLTKYPPKINQKALDNLTS